MADQKQVGEEIPNEEGIMAAELTSGTVPSEKGGKVKDYSEMEEPVASSNKAIIMWWLNCST